MVVELASSLDTYVYAMITAIIWNFYWTRKLKGKVFGDPKDETTAGVLVDHQQLENRVHELEERVKFGETVDEPSENNEDGET